MWCKYAMFQRVRRRPFLCNNLNYSIPGPIVLVCFFAGALISFDLSELPTPRYLLKCNHLVSALHQDMMKVQPVSPVSGSKAVSCDGRPVSLTVTQGICYRSIQAPRGRSITFSSWLYAGALYDSAKQGRSASQLFVSGGSRGNSHGKACCGPDGRDVQISQVN